MERRSISGKKRRERNDFSANGKAGREELSKTSGGNKRAVCSAWQRRSRALGPAIDSSNALDGCGEMGKNMVWCENFADHQNFIIGILF